LSVSGCDRSSGNILQAVIATVAGIYYFDAQQNDFRKSAFQTTTEIRSVAVSTTDESTFYAGAGNQLIRSIDGGKTFQPGYIVRFPSRITTIKTSGNNHLDTIWVGTENGGVYISYLPNYWHSLVPEEIGIGINKITFNPVKPSSAYIATKGVSCIKVAIPFLHVHAGPPIGSNVKMVKIFLEMDNPCPAMKVDFHLIQIPTGQPPIFYKIQVDNPEPSTTPAPYPFTLPGNTELPEIYLGDVEITNTADPTLFLAGLFEENTWFPVASISTIQIKGDIE